MGCSLGDSPDHRVSQGLLLSASIQHWSRRCFGQGAVRVIGDCSVSSSSSLFRFLLFPAKLCFLGLGVISPTSWITFLPLVYLFVILFLVLDWCQQMTVATDKTSGKPSIIFRPCCVPGTVSWKDFSFSSGSGKHNWTFKGLFSMKVLGRNTSTSLSARPQGLSLHS